MRKGAEDKETRFHPAGLRGFVDQVVELVTERFRVDPVVWWRPTRSNLRISHAR